MVSWCQNESSESHQTYTSSEFKCPGLQLTLFTLSVVGTRFNLLTKSTSTNKERFKRLRVSSPPSRHLYCLGLASRKMSGIDNVHTRLVSYFLIWPFEPPSSRSGHTKYFLIITFNVLLIEPILKWSKIFCPIVFWSRSSQIIGSMLYIPRIYRLWV